MHPAEQRGFGPAEFKDEPDDRDKNNISPAKAKAIAAGLAVAGLFGAGAAVENKINSDAEAEHQKIEDSKLAQNHGAQAMDRLSIDVQTSAIYDWEQDGRKGEQLGDGTTKSELPVKEQLTKEELITLVKQLENFYKETYVPSGATESNVYDWERDLSNPDTLLVRIINQKTDPEVRATALKTLIKRQENNDAYYIKQQVQNNETVRAQYEPPVIVMLLDKYAKDADSEIAQIAESALNSHPQWQRGEK